MIHWTTRFFTVAAVLLGAWALACGGGDASPTPSPTATRSVPTATVSPTASPLPTKEPPRAEPSTPTPIAPTATAVPPTSTATTIPPTARSLSPTATRVPRAATSVPPTATQPPVGATPQRPTSTPTPRPPTATPVAPTATPRPPTATPVAPTATPRATVTPLPPTATRVPPSPTKIPPTATPSLQAAQSVSLGPSKDNTLYEDATGSISNGAGKHVFAGKTKAGKIRRAVSAFDIADIPDGSTIESVTLTLHMSRFPIALTQAPSVTVELRRLEADWGEGTSAAPANEGGGIKATSGDATWADRFFDTETWGSPGGDFSPTVSASKSVGGIGDYTWGSTDQMVADVQAWLDNPSTNFGWILIGNEAQTQTAKRFGSKDNAANPPALTVTFASPQAAAGGAGLSY